MEGPPPPNALVIDDYDLLVFVDETGHEELLGESSLFGVGGIITYGADYLHHVQRPWYELRGRMNLGATVPLHAATDFELYRPHLGDLQAFFEKGMFVRHAALVTDRTAKNTDAFTAAAVGGLLRNMGHALADAINAVDVRRVVYIVEHSQRLHYHYEKLVGPTGPSLVYSNGRRRSFPHAWAALPKRSCTAGLEIADFVLHAAQGHVREKARRADYRERKDFQAVFRSVPAHFVKYMEITSAHATPNYGPRGLIRLGL